MIEELKAWLNREPQAGQAVSILAKHGPALLAAVELAESCETLLLTKYERGCDGGEITYRGKVASENMRAAMAAARAYRAAKEQKCSVTL